MPFLPLVLALATSRALAAPTQLDDEGRWSDPLIDATGFASLGTLAIDAAAGTLTLAPGATTGTAVTKSITPAAFARWKRVLIKSRALVGQSVTLYFRDAGGVDHPLTLGPTAVPGFTSEATVGIDAAASSFGALRVDLAGALGAPSIDQIQVEWEARAVLRVGLERGAASGVNLNCSGAVSTLEVPVSVSHVKAQSLLVLVPLLDGALTPDLGFDDRLRFVSASHGGGYTGAAPLTLPSGQVVPAYHLYWALGDAAAGDTLRLRAQLQIPPGTLATTAYNGLVAKAVATNASEVQSVAVNFAAVASTQVSVTKTGIGGLYNISGINRAFAGSTVRFRVSVKNIGANVCGSRFVRPLVWDPLSPANLALAGTSVVNGAPHHLVGFAYTAGTQAPYTADPAGAATTVPANSLWAQLPTLELGDTWTGELSVDLAPGAAANTSITNTVTVNSGYAPQVANRTGAYSFQIGIDDQPKFTGLKGEVIAGQSAMTSGDDFNGSGIAPGGSHTWLLSIQNDGASVLRNALAFDKIPSPFVLEAFYVAPGLGATLWYNTTGAANSTTSPPDVTGATLGPSWTSSPPADKTTVKWVALQVDAIASSILPDPTGRPRNVTAALTVRDTSGAAQLCTTQNISNVGAFRVPSYETFAGVATNLASPLNGSSFETTSIKPLTPSFEGLTVTATPGTTGGGTRATWVVDVLDAKLATPHLTDDALGVTLDVALPTASINGVVRPLPLAAVDSDGGIVSYAGLPARLAITWPRIAKNTRRSVVITTEIPRGVVDGDAANMVATVSANDDLCGATKTVASGAIAFEVAPYLQLAKRVDYKVAEPGHALTYTLSAFNSGDGAASEVVVFDQLPDETRFASVVAHHGERCWFSDASPPEVPATVDDDALTLDFVFASGAFVDGVEGPAGTWSSPLGAATRWLACQMDDPGLSPPQVPADRVARDLEVHVAIATTTPLSAVITDRGSVDGADLLVAVSNPVQTLVALAPSVDLADECPSATASGEAVRWRSSYTNRSTQPDETLTVTLTLPAGSDVRDVRWQLPGPSGTTSESFSTPPAGEWTAASAPDGTLTITWHVHLTLMRLNGAPTLASLAGVSLDLGVATAGAADASLRTWTSSATASDGAAQSVTVAGGCVVPVHDPNPGIIVLVDRPLVLPGDVVTFEIIVRNLGLHDAENVIIDDVLPPGFDYVEGSTRVLTPGWSFTGTGEPGQSGPSAATLTWSLAQGSPIDGDATATGTIPIDSGEIHFTIQATTLGTVPTGVDLEDCGTIAMGPTASGDTLTDSDPSDNESCVTLRSPGPDPTVTIEGPESLLPGAQGSYTIRTWNLSPRAAEGTTVLYRVPDLDDDGDADVALLGASAFGGESIWYSNATTTTAPTFDFDAPTPAGWSATPVPATTWVAFRVGHLDGFSATRTFEVRVATTTPGGALSMPGEVHPHAVDVAMLGAAAGTDDDLTNNHDDTVTRIPGVDVRLAKTCSPEGAYPGARPGDTVGFTIEVVNKGAVTTFGVRVEDLVPAWLTGVALTPVSAVITTADGQVTSARDTAGNPLAAAVRWTRSGDAWLLGAAEPSDPQYYRAVGLAPGNKVTLTLSGTLALTAQDGDVATNSATAVLDHQVGYAGEPEQYTADNSDDCRFTVYRPNPAVTKRGVLAERVGAEAVGAGVAGERIRWTVGYQNEGHAAANDVVLTDVVPAGATYVVGSLGPIAPGMTVEYQDGAGAWTYKPAVDGPDANVKAFRVKFASFPAPLNDVFGAGGKAAFDRGLYHGTVYDAERGGVVVDMQSPDRFAATYTTEPIAADGSTVAAWSQIVVGSYGAELRPLKVDVIDATTQATILTNVALDSGGAASIAAIDATPGTGHPSLRLVIKFPAPSEDTVERLPSLTSGASPPRGQVQALLDNGLYVGVSAGTLGLVNTGTVTVWRPSGDQSYQASPLADPSGRFTAFAATTYVQAAPDNLFGSGGDTFMMPEGLMLANANDTTDGNLTKAVKVTADGTGVKVELLPCPAGRRCVLSGARADRAFGQRFDLAGGDARQIHWIPQLGTTDLTMFVPESEGGLVEDPSVSPQIPWLSLGWEDPRDIPPGYVFTPVGLGLHVAPPQWGYEAWYWRPVAAGADGYSATRVPDLGFGINGSSGLYRVRGGIMVDLTDEQIPNGSGELGRCTIWDLRGASATRTPITPINTGACTAYVSRTTGLHQNGPFVIAANASNVYGLWRMSTPGTWSFTPFPGNPTYAMYPSFGAIDVNGDRALDRGFITGGYYDASFKWHLYFWVLDAGGGLTQYEPLAASLIDDQTRVRAMLSDGVFLVAKAYSQTRWALRWNGAGFDVQNVTTPSGGVLSFPAAARINPVDGSLLYGGPDQMYLAIPDGPASAPVRFVPTGMVGGGTSTGTSYGVEGGTPLEDGCWAITGVNIVTAAIGAPPKDLVNSDAHSEIRLFHCPGERAPETLKRVVAVYRGTGTPELTYDTVIDPTCQDQIVNNVAITTSSLQITTADDEARWSVPVEAADLSVAAELARTVVSAGGQTTATITVTNHGPADARDVVVDVRRAAGLEVLEGLVPYGLSEPWQVGDLAAGDSATLTLTVKVPAGTTAGQVLALSASASAGTVDCGPDDDARVLSLLVGGGPNVWVTLAGPPSVGPGGTIVWTVTYGNNGNTPATHTVVTFTPPGGVTVTGPTSVDAGTVPPGGGGTFTVTTTIDGCDVVGDTLRALATIAADQDAWSDDNQAAVDTLVLAGTGSGATLDDDCDGIDDDCDGEVDEDSGDDNDGDGFSGCDGDCDDTTAAASPVGVEGCDGVDNDCDGVVDDGGATLCSGGGACATVACGGVAGCVTTPIDDDGDGFDVCVDCDDDAGAVNPGALEVCNGVDDDCDDQIDEGGDALCVDTDDCTADACTATGCTHTTVDDDGDGFAICVDCDDHDGAVHPGALEVCNGDDDDCDDQIDEGGAALCVDTDPCTVEACNGAAGCALTPKVCEEGDPCTTNACDPDTGACVSTPLPPRPVSCGAGDCAAAGTETCVGGVWVDDCDERSAPDVPDTSCSETRVAYAIVNDEVGQPLGTIRCLQDVATGRATCETVAPDSLELRIYPAFFCPMD